MATSSSPSVVHRSRLLVARLVLEAAREGLRVTYVARESLATLSFGCLLPHVRRVVVAEDLGFVKTAQVLSRELGHWLLGHAAEVPGDVAEAEAELVSHLVCRDFGVVTNGWTAITGPELGVGAPGTLPMRLSGCRVERVAAELIQRLTTCETDRLRRRPEAKRARLPKGA